MSVFSLCVFKYTLNVFFFVATLKNLSQEKKTDVTISSSIASSKNVTFSRITNKLQISQMFKVTLISTQKLHFSYTKKKTLIFDLTIFAMQNFSLFMRKKMCVPNFSLQISHNLEIFQQRFFATKEKSLRSIEESSGKLVDKTRQELSSEIPNRTVLFLVECTSEVIAEKWRELDVNTLVASWAMTLK